jgi:DNA repair protein RecO (recombination protein O)
MLQKTKGIVLHVVKYNDTSIIVDVFTSLRGRCSLMASLPKSRRSPLRSSVFQPLALVEIETDFHNRHSLSRIKNARLYYPFLSIPFNRKKTTIAFFLAEFMLYSLREESENLPLFAYLESSILWLDNCSSNFSNFHLVFMMHLSAFLGFYPNLIGYHKGYYFDMMNGCYISSQPIVSGTYLLPEEAYRINTMMRMNYNNMHLFGMSRAQRNRCIEVILLYYRIHLAEFPQLKSLDVLREVFD